MTIRDDARSRWRAWWTASAAVSLLAAAWWLRSPVMPVLAVELVCAVAAVAAAVPLRAGRRRAAAAGVLLLAFGGTAGISERALWSIDNNWPVYSAALEADGERKLQAALADAVVRLRAASRAALAAAGTGSSAFATLRALPSGPGEMGVALYRDSVPVAWAGTMRVPPEALTARIDAVFTPFYLILFSNEVRGSDRAVATLLVHAEAPADKLAASLDAPLARRAGVRGFSYVSGGDADEAGVPPFTVDGRVLFGVRPVPAQRPQALLNALEDARSAGGPLLLFALLAFVGAAWRRGASLRGRLIALWAVVAVVAFAPLNEYSNVSRVFDPAVYRAAFGGPFTANLAALVFTSASALLALMALQRAPGRVLSRRQAVVAVVLVAGLGPLLLRDLGRGIVVPGDGASFPLWIAWQGALFLAAMVIVVAGIAAGRDALAARRGIAPWVAPVIAAMTAFVGPMLWRAPEGWPDWYTMLWVAAIVALALARRTKWFLVTCAVVAGCGAVTLVWGAMSRARADMARADVAALRTLDAETVGLLERYARSENVLGPATSRAEMLSRYARSDLAAAGYPLHLAAWRPDGNPLALLDLAPFPERQQDVQALAAEARRTGAVKLRRSVAVPWMQMMLAVPHADGSVSTVVVAPRTRLIPDDPFAPFLGLAVGPPAEPPYGLSLAEAGAAGSTVPESERWQRRGNELHGDWTLNGPNTPIRVHAAVELRPMETLVPRGALLVLFDLVIVGVLWTANAAAGGSLGRWMRMRRDEWARSFRARLTLALFAFSLLPVVVFAVIAVRRLQADDRRSRELVVLETLRGAISTRELAQLDEMARRFGTPLLLYEDGALRVASEPLYYLLAPTGRFLEPTLREGLAREELLATTREEHVGGTTALVGYRSVDVPNAAPGQIVLAAPARSDAVALDRRRNDLAILVLFSAAMAALAALWLSGVAARQLASPIDALRRAALAVAGGAAAPLPALAPPSEFAPVFTAFRQMATDLGESRRALEEAQRRTAAVLRTVASGVIAFDDAGLVSLANPRAETLLGGPLVPGQPLGAGTAGVVGNAARRFATGRAEEEEFDFAVGPRQLHARLTRLPVTRGVVATIDDVTELARAQRVLAWGEMARQVAHEIKNPLTPIRLGIQHLQRARRDDRGDFDQVLERNAERILAEIDRLDEIARTFSRFGTTSAARPDGAPVVVGEVLRDVLALERLGGEDGVQWSLDAGDVSARAVAREDEFREVLLNVFENARLAGARRVSVGVTTDAGRITIDVRDDGEGIAAETLPRVFEPHFSTRTSGSGLGLAICRRLVEGWGGAIALASTRGTGTIVTITLAAADSGGEIPPR